MYLFLSLKMGVTTVYRTHAAAMWVPAVRGVRTTPGGGDETSTKIIPQPKPSQVIKKLILRPGC
jgi:hypothetical protein